MKKINLGRVFLLIVLGIVISSCSKDDTTQNTSSADLLGVWNCSAVDYTGTSVTDFLGQSLTSDFIGEGYNIDFTFTLTENPNIASSNGSYDIKLSTTTFGQTTVQNIEDNAFTFVGTWSLDDNKLTIIDQEGESSTANIVKLTDSVLEVSIQEVRTITNGGATVTATTNTHITFVK